MTPQPTIAPYGSWKSPITSDMLVAGSVSFTGLALDGDDLYWSESRPEAKGAAMIVRRSASGEVHDLLPEGLNARTRVHEYGGGAFAVSGGTVYFSNYADQRLYRLEPGATDPTPITPESGGNLRYADAVVDGRRGRLICVREEHGIGQEAANTIVGVETGGAGDEAGGTVLVSGSDFYASPRISPDGSRLAWVMWKHPNMPWDGTELWVAPFRPDGTVNLGAAMAVAGDPTESVVQPEWGPDGSLYFASDRTGWWNLYRWRGGLDEPEALCPMEAEFARPLWQFGGSAYAVESAGRIVCAYAVQGVWRLGLLDIETRTLDTLDIPYNDVWRYLVARDGKAYFVAGSPTEHLALVEMDLATCAITVLRRSSSVEVDEGYLSAAVPVEFPTEGGRTAFGFFYPPRNRDFAAPEGERPPLLVMSHGGPTSATSGTLDLSKQYWTSRGIAVLDVNYGGSTGYGTEYRRRLNGQWGVLDVQDCANGALYLAREGLVDGNRLMIRGGSAGGLTTLNALTFTDVFRTGASYYGVADMEALALDTHKFEARYLDSMVGPFPEQRDLYHARSAVRHTDRLDRPVIFFQGLEDMVVPPSQSEMMVDALRRKGLPVAYLAFEGEQHGFRKAETIKRSIEAELYFYSRILGFDLADPIEPVDIENLPQTLN